MLELFRDPAWQIAALVVAVLSALLTIYFFRVQHQRKDLRYKVYFYQIFTMSDHIKGRVSLMADGRERNDLWMAIIHFRNVGTTPVLQQDFERPLSVKLLAADGTPAEVISATVAHVVPDELRVVAQVDGASVTVQPTLLNAGDRFSVQVLASDLRGCEEVVLDYRIAGVTKILEEEWVTKWSLLRQFAQFTFVLQALFFASACFSLGMQAASGSSVDVTGQLFRVSAIGIFAMNMIVYKHAHFLDKPWQWKLRRSRS